jgi:hypothetical protein
LEDDIETALRFVGIEESAARTHALRIVEGLARFPIEGFRLLRPQPLTPEIPIAEYEFGKTGYSVNNAKPSDAPKYTPTDHGGSQCEQENLLFLARAFEIAASAIPDLWQNPDADLVGKVTAPRQHSDTLSEWWWLSRWSAGFTAAPNVKLNPACAKDVDWRLSWTFWPDTHLHVNLEVKRRIGDVLRAAQGEDLNPTEIFTAGLEDKKGSCKFRPSGPDEINVLGLTLIGEIDRDVQLEAEKWLGTRDDIDAVLLYTRLSGRKAGFDAQIVRKHGLLKQVLNPDISGIDQGLHGRIKTPIPIPFSQLRFLP